MEKLKRISARWWFFALLLLAQTVLMPFASRNFAPQDIGRIIPATLANAPQTRLGDWNILFQSVSLLFLILLLVFRNRVRTLFNAYVALSYLAFAFIQNVAFTEQYGFSVVTVNLVMFLFVAYVWIREALRPQGRYDFGNFRWKYAWMIVLALFAYWCPFTLRGEPAGGQRGHLPDHRRRRLHHRVLQHGQLLQSGHRLAGIRPPAAPAHFALLRRPQLPPSRLPALTSDFFVSLPTV